MVPRPLSARFPSVLIQLGFLLIVAEVLAQEPKKDSNSSRRVGSEPTATPTVKSVEKRASSPPQARLHMVVQTDPSLSEHELTDKIKLAADRIDAHNRASVHVRAIEKATYDALGSLISGDPGDRGLQGKGITISPFVGNSSLWLISTGDPHDRLLAMTIVSDDAEGKKSEVPFETAGAFETDKPLQYYQPGLFLLKLPDGLKPKQCVLKMQLTGNKPRFEPANWPVSIRYYIVTLDDFKPDPNLLFEQMKNPEVISPPFKEIGPLEPASLVLASLWEHTARPNKLWVGHVFNVGLEAPGKTAPTRAWILFPLDPAEAKKEARRLDELSKKEGYEAICRTIREGREAPSTDGYGISPESSPHWYELTKDGKGLFTGSFKLQQIDRWKAKGASETWWVVVYEFGEGDGIRPIAVEHPKSKARVFAVDERIDEWPAGINKLP